MNAISLEQTEKKDRMMEISNLKSQLNEIYQKKGPASSDYISLSLKLRYLIREYFDLNN